jgi:hypothetical protein
MKKILCLLFSYCALAGCSDSSEDVSTASSQKGPVSGYVGLIDAQGNSIADRSGVTVSVSGTSITATTDGTGKWTAPDIPLGIHTITFSKSGFGTKKEFSYAVVGGDTAYMPLEWLGQPPSQQLVITKFEPYENQSTLMDLIYDNYPALLCISTDSVALATDPLSAPYISPQSGGSASIYIPLSVFPSGTKLYATVCAENTRISYYFDPSQNKNIYTAIGPHSNIRSLVRP